MNRNVYIRISVLVLALFGLITVFITNKLKDVSNDSISAVSAQSSNTNTKPQPQTSPQAQTEEEKILAALNKSIEGKEKLPAEQVWKNIQSFKGVPAERIPRIMGAFTRALGVSCSHCHVVNQWEKEDLPTKQIARDMLAMVAKINNEHLKGIKNIGGKTQVSCSTCHRGQTIPDGRLPEPKKPS